MLNILADENIPALQHYFQRLGEVRQVRGRSVTSKQLADIDVLLVRSVTQVNAQLLSNSAVRFVGTATSGVDHIDRDWLRQQGIGFAYSPGSNANSVVEYVLAAIAAIDDKLERLFSGGVVGIVGYGVIGKAMAARLQALGIRFRVFDPWLDQQTIPHAASLQQVLSCDIVSLHAELTQQEPWPSLHLLGEPEISAMQPDSLLINASRGPVVDNAALLRLLEQGAAPQTVLDVWENEPAIDHALLHKVALGTPHIAGYSSDGKLLATAMLAAAVARHFELPEPTVTSPAGSAGVIEVDGPITGPALVRHLVHNRYDIRQDDARLRAATFGRPVQASAEGFDRLRREYPQRRELAGSTVRGVSAANDGIQLLRGLACEPLEQGAEP